MVGKRKWMLGITAGTALAFVLGAVAVVAFNGTLAYTNSNEFCYGCHIGMDTIVEEYHESRHFDNASGVQAACHDCHVPKEFMPKMWAKIRASKDVYHKLVGTVNLENFEEQRVHQAERVWAIMIDRDSKECRNCHAVETWNTDKQSIRARKQHLEEMEQTGETCVECHIGVAHRKPAVR